MRTPEKGGAEGVISPHPPGLYLGYISAASRAERRDEGDHQQRAEEALTPRRARATLAHSRRHRANKGVRRPHISPYLPARQ